MKSPWLIQRLLSGLGLAALTVAAGCASILEPRSRISDRDRKEAEWATMKTLTARLENRVDAIEAVQIRTQEETASFRRQAEYKQNAHKERIVVLENQVTALETALATAERARAEDKQIVLESIKNARAARPTPVRGREHVVQQGETLSEIAKAYHVTVDAIVKANPLKDAHTIRIGQTLFIPD